MQVITSGCATYEPWASALGGIVGGLLVLPGSLFVLHVLKVDDPVDAVTVCYIGIITLLRYITVCYSMLHWHQNACTTCVLHGANSAKRTNTKK